MRRKLVFGVIGGFLVAVVAGLPANLPACHQGSSSHSHHSHQSLEAAFHKMDVNHDGILTESEFVAAHHKMNTSQAAARYEQLAAKGGTTKRNGVRGMTLAQFKAAHTARH
jgi:Ca2+-binding EF-hand superfamily protein